MPARREEDFRPVNGPGLAIGTFGVEAFVLLVGVLQPAARLAPWGYALAALLGLMLWLVLLRPRVWIEPGTLVLRAMVSTTRLPLESVEAVTVRQVLVVSADGRRYTSAAAGRSRRAMVRADRGQPVHSVRRSRGAGTPQRVGAVDPADYVESRLVELTRRARVDAAAREGRGEVGRPGGGVVRREWATPQISALVTLSLLVVVLALLR